MNATSRAPINDWTRDLPWIDRDDAAIDAYVSRLSGSSLYDVADKLRQWRDNGVVTFENVVSFADIDALLADIEHFRTHFADYQIPIEIRGKQMESTDVASLPLDEPGVKINHLHCFSRAAARLSLTREVVDFLGHIFCDPAVVMQSLTFWRGSEQPIHLDYPYVRQQKRLAFMAASWTPLEDIQPDAGPLGYYPGLHRIDKSGFFDWGHGSIVFDERSTRTPMEFARYLSERVREHNIERVEFCPKKGDVLLWHGNLPHEGTKVKDPARTRKSYVTHYSSLQDMPGWMRAPLARLRGLGVFEKAGYAFEMPDLRGRKKLPSWRQTRLFR